jgi:predicted kinase
MSEPTLHLLVGLPGAGKTTLSKIIQNLTGALRVSSDDYRSLLFPRPKFSQEEHDSLYAMIDHNVEHLLQKGNSVIYDANLNRRIHRNEKYAIAKKYNADVVLWWVQTSHKVSKQRRIDEAAHHHLVPAHETPEEMHDRISELFEEPGVDEKYIAIDGQDIKPEDVAIALEKM